MIYYCIVNYPKMSGLTTQIYYYLFWFYVLIGLCWMSPTGGLSAIIYQLELQSPGSPTGLNIPEGSLTWLAVDVDFQLDA